jgi:LacI family transcriptional regulator
MMEALSLLSLPNPPTAIIAGGTQIQVGVLRALYQMKLSVGRDVSLIGTDRTDVSTTYPGTLTIVDRDLDVVGRNIAQLLMERIHGDRSEPKQLCFPTYLTLGRSCGQPVIARAS